MSSRQEVTRARLLDATLGVLVSHGSAGATSRQIAAAAGVNLQAITYHFGSKDELVAQALVDAVRRWIAPARTALTGIGEDPVGRLLAAVLALQQALDDASAYFPAYVEALAAAPRHEAVRAEIVGLLQELRDGLAGSIVELRDAGLIADWVDPEAMAALVVAAGDGFVLHTMLDPQGPGVERTLGQVVQLLLAARTASPLAVPAPVASGRVASGSPGSSDGAPAPATAVPLGGDHAIRRDHADGLHDHDELHDHERESTREAARPKAVVRRSALGRAASRPRPSGPDGSATGPDVPPAADHAEEDRP